MRIVDIHTHGMGGYDTRAKDADDILKIADLQGAQGVTDIILTIYSGPIEAMRNHMTATKEAMERQLLAFSDQPSAAHNSKSKHQKSANIKGIHLEGPFLNPLQSGALDRESFQMPSEKTWERLIEGFEDVVKIVTIAPELEGSLSLIKDMSNMGIAASLGHSDATYHEAEKAFHAGAKGITHLFNAMRGFHHREPGIAGFGLINQDIYIEVITDPFHLNDRTLELVFQVKDPKKIIIVSDSVKETGIVPNNLAIENDCGVIQGGSMAIVDAAKRLINLGFDKAKIMDCIGVNPLSYILSG